MQAFSQYGCDSGSRRGDAWAPAGRIALAGFLALAGTGLGAACDEGAKRSFANIEQIADVLARARVNQAGTGNALEILQDGRDLTVDAYVRGQMNRAVTRANTITQTGEGATANVSVVGDENAFSITQGAAGGPGRNEALLSVTGDFNTADIRQLNDFGEAYFNSATIVQEGNGNSGRIAQTVAPGTLVAGGNVATITQTGDDNEALIEQTGADNSASIEQEGSLNKGTILQEGEGLSALLVQSGVALEYTINQTGCVIASGCGAVVVTQDGP